MNRSRSALTLLLPFSLLCQGAGAATPVFVDNQLQLPEVVFVSGQNTRYYAGVKLTMDEKGGFRVRQARNSPLAVVDAVDITLYGGASPAASVQARGVLSIPCVALHEPVVLTQDAAFIVVLAETTQAPGEVCMSLVAETPFSVSVPLPLDGVPAGDYRVLVNGLETGFTLPPSP